MKKKLFFIFFMQSVFLNAQELEKNIYKTLDNFVKNKNELSFKVLSKQEQTYIVKVTAKKEHLALVILQCNKGYYLKEINKNKEAILTYENAWKRFLENKLSNYDIIEYCLKPLGNLYTKTKDYTNAESIIKYYISLARKNSNTPHRVAGIINLMKVYQSVGNHYNVLQLTNKVLKGKGISRIQKEKIESIRAMSLIYLNKNENTIIAKEKLIDGLSSSSQYQIQYKLALEEKEFEKGLYYFKFMKQLLQKDILSIREKAKLYVEEAQLYFLRNENIKSKKCLNEGLKLLIPNYIEKKDILKETLYAENTLIDIFDLYAVIESNSKEVLEYYDLSFYVANLLEKNSTSQETKIIYQKEKRARSEKCIELLLKEYDITLNKNLITQAFYYAEKGKAFVLNEKLTREKLLSNNPNDVLLLKEKKKIEEQEKLTNELIDTQLRKDKALNVGELNKRLNTISIELKRLQMKVEMKYGIKENFSMKYLYEKLKEKQTVFVEYFYGKRAIYQFVIDDESIDVYAIKLTEKIKKDVLDYIRFFEKPSIINNNIKEYTDKSFVIYQELLLNNVSTVKTIILIPDGLLNYIPFETLLTEETSDTNFSKMPFLVKKQNVVYNSSVELFLKEESFSIEEEKVLGVFPVFLNTKNELKYSIKEAESISREIPAKILMNEEATKSNFIKQISNYEILHLSTHASGGDFIKSAYVEFYDDKLTLNELYGLDLKLNLAVLSACETGVGRLEKGEGAMSLARGFQYAGVKNILFTLWEINDKSTSNLMKLFYEKYKTYQSVSYANQKSKIAYLNDENIENDRKSPYYWGAFVYYGAHTQIVEPQKLSVYILVIVSLIIISLSIIYISNKK